MATAQPEKQYLFGSLECHKKYMDFIRKAVESAVDGQQGRQTDGKRGREKGGQKGRKKGGNDITLYIASAPELHAHTLSSIVQEVQDVSNLHVMYYFRDLPYQTIIEAANETVNAVTNESAAQEKRRLIVQGTAEDRTLLKSYLNKKKNCEIKLSCTAQKRYFHTKWAAFHCDQEDQVQLLLTSANLIYDHLKDDQEDAGSRIVNSLIEIQLPYTEFQEQFVEPINMSTTDTPAVQAVRDKHNDGGDRTSPQQAGNYSNVEIYEQVQRFVAEAVDHCETAKTELHVVSAFFRDEVILKSLLAQTQQARRDNQLGMSIVFKYENNAAQGLKKLNEDIKGLDGTQDWKTGVEIIRAKDFHHKFLGYGPVVWQGRETFQVLMMSANVDTQHMSVNENPSHHNLDWVTKIPVEKQDYVNMLRLTTLPKNSGEQPEAFKNKFDAMNCISLHDLVKRYEAVSVDSLSKDLQELELSSSSSSS